VQSQIGTLHDQRAVGAIQPVNIDPATGTTLTSNWSMFLYDNMLFYWEAYDVAVRELVFTIISGVVALTIIALVLIPHWTAVCFVTPMILLTYCNFLGTSSIAIASKKTCSTPFLVYLSHTFTSSSLILTGTLQFFGLHINGIFYICVVVSVGLLVDFLLHILLRYYETASSSSCTSTKTKKSRNDCVQETLETMGASILLGGLTTFLAVVPLCLSSTKIFMTVFLAFLAMVVLGILHGLVLLPVILSLVGPTLQTTTIHSNNSMVESTGIDSCPSFESQPSSSSATASAPRKDDGYNNNQLAAILVVEEEIWV